MRTIFAAVLVGAVTATSSLNDAEFMKYITAWGKSYATREEYTFRQRLFQQTHFIIQGLNKSQSSSFHAHNNFSDWTHEEIKSMLGDISNDEIALDKVKEYDLTNISTETYFNWVDQGAVTPIKDQGSCGSCWAFSTTGTLEGAHYIATGELLSLSEQQLVECAHSRYNNMGCGGGLSTNSYEYAMKHPLATESDYPYTGKDGNCQRKAAAMGIIQVTEWSWITPQSPDAFKAALQIQPVSVSIEADHSAITTYKSGIITGDSGCGTQMDHAVLAVGWGTENGTDYWLIKNSWGTTWGEDGFFKLAIEEGLGVCGVQTKPNVATTN